MCTGFSTIASIFNLPSIVSVIFLPLFIPCNRFQLGFWEKWSIFDYYVQGDQSDCPVLSRRRGEECLGASWGLSHALLFPLFEPRSSGNQDCGASRQLSLTLKKPAAGSFPQLSVRAGLSRPQASSLVGGSSLSNESFSSSLFFSIKWGEQGC